MGIIIAKFRGKKTTTEVLESLDSQIKEIESFTKDTQQRQKRIVARFIVLSGFIYIAAVIILYLYYFPDNLYDARLCIGSLVFAFILIRTVKDLLTYYYNRKISRNSVKLESLKQEKKKLLEKVMETETYKVAKSILEKFSKEQVERPLTSSFTTPVKSIIPTSKSVATDLRQRPPLSTPLSEMRPPNRTISSLRTPQQEPPKTPGVMEKAKPLSLPRSILPKDRSIFDKMVDYLVGDGPSHRYALICNSCSGHNGMALPEEVEYLSYYCGYCHAFNPAKKKRPVAPKLDLVLDSQLKGSESSSSDDEDSTTSDDTKGSKTKVSDNDKLSSDFDKLSDEDAKPEEGHNATVNVESAASESVVTENQTKLEGAEELLKTDI